MKIRLLAIWKVLVFLILGVILFGKIQNILTPRWENVERVVNGVNEVDFDVLFLGASHVTNGISPMELYEHHGIRSYALSSSMQSIPVSYYLLEKAYQTNEIQTVVLDVSMMFQKPDNIGIRYIMDTLGIGALKLEMAMDYEKNEWGNGFLSAILPILNYHTNWNGLTIGNFQQNIISYPILFGQEIYNQSVPAEFDLKRLDQATIVLSEYQGKQTERIGDHLNTKIFQEVLYNPSILDENLGYFHKIQMLCQAHGSNLVLIKIPTLSLPNKAPGSWNKLKSSAMKKFAKGQNLIFLDLLYDVDSLVSFDTDTMDGGIHLNSDGAKKVCRYLGDYLIKNHLAISNINPLYDNSLKKYQKINDVFTLIKTEDFYEYISQLKNTRGWDVLIVAGYEYAMGMSENDYSLLKDLGLKLIADGKPNNSYIAVMENGNVQYEAVSDYELDYETQIGSAAVKMASRNWWVSPPGSSIQINGSEYVRSNGGLTFVVYDSEANCVIDSVTFDTHEASKPCIRDQGQAYQILHTYESIVCYDGR